MSNMELMDSKRTAWSQVPWYVIEASGGGYYIANTEKGEPGSFIVGPDQGSLTLDDASRIVECVNALNGVADVVSFMKQAKQLLMPNAISKTNNANRHLMPGQEATTDYNGTNTLTKVTILERKDDQSSQSGVMYRVTPALNNGTEELWYDADWFQAT